jgi:hypothetical protein
LAGKQIEMKNKVLFVVKAIVSIALIWYLLSKTEFAAIYASLVSANLFWLLLALITLYIGKILTTYRWQRLLRAQGIQIPFKNLLASVFVGQFFNSFLPTTVGGDAMRAYDTASQSKESMKSVMSVFSDRLIGVFALALLAVIALIVGLISGEDVSFLAIPVLLVFAVCFFGIWLIFDDRLVLKVVAILEKIKMGKIAGKMRKAYSSLTLLKDKKRVLIIAFLISLALQINVVLFYYFIGVSLDIDVSILYYFMIVPIALVVLLVPFSINGIGLREGVFVFLFTELGVASQDAIALSVLSFLLTLTQAIVGGIIFALRGINLRRSEVKPAVSERPPQ